MNRWHINEYRVFKINLETLKYLCIVGEMSELNIEATESILTWEENKYLGVEFFTGGIDDDGIRLRVTHAKKKVFRWIIGEQKHYYQYNINTQNAIIKIQIIDGSETWRLTERHKRRKEAAEMDALKRSAKISRIQRVRH